LWQKYDLQKFLLSALETSLSHGSQKEKKADFYLNLTRYKNIGFFTQKVTKY
jgi:hypothetical protein